MMKAKSILVLVTVAAIFGVGSQLFSTSAPAKKETRISSNPDFQTAVFAAGCFWCVEANFETVQGVKEVESGYTGGHTVDPNYEEVCSHTTGHLESVRVTYDANVVTYNDLLEVFWRTFDPTDGGGSFHDRGESYTSAIFVADDMQRGAAKRSKQALRDSGRFEKMIVTPILDLAEFYPAEDYHQDYYLKNPIRYKAYRYGSGRDQFIQRIWGADKSYQIVGPQMAGAAVVSKTRNWTDQFDVSYRNPSDDSLKGRLNSLQYYVTQREGTERPFSNEYWDEKREGIYVDVVSGETSIQFSRQI